MTLRHDVPHDYAQRLTEDFDVRLGQFLQQRWRWSSDVLLDALRVAATTRGLLSDAVALVDPRLLTLVLHLGERSPAYIENRRVLRRLCKSAPLVLLPLDCDDHWSLLLHVRTHKLWVALDANAPFVAHTLQQLRKRRVCDDDVTAHTLAMRSVAAVDDDGLAVAFAGACAMEASGQADFVAALDVLLARGAHYDAVLLQEARALSGADDA